MPLFERREARNERLMKGALTSIHLAVNQEFQGTNEATRHTGWLSGGGLTALALLNMGSLSQAWGKGSEEKALALAEVFTLAMISRWYWEVEKNSDVSDEVRLQARRMCATNILWFFDDFSDEAVEDFMRCDTQFNHDKSRDDERLSRVEWSMLMSRARRACGATGEPDLSKVTFPITSYMEQLASGIEGLSVGDLIVVPLALRGGELEMRTWMERWLRELPG